MKVTITAEVVARICPSFIARFRVTDDKVGKVIITHQGSSVDDPYKPNFDAEPQQILEAVMALQEWARLHNLDVDEARKSD